MRKRERKNVRFLIKLFLKVCVLISILALALIAASVPAVAQPSTPFLISGEVNYDTGDPVNNPNVTITNLNTSAVFTAEKNASSNYYQVLNSSCNVSAEHILHFYASGNKGNFTDFNHTVTQEEMNKGGFVQNVSISLPVIPMPDLLVTGVNAYHYAEGSTLWETSSKLYPAWFNLTNYVDVTVKNNGTADAGAFNVSLYADGEFIGEQLISNLSGSSSETLVFEWKPMGEDPLGWTDTAEGAILTHTGTSKAYC